MASRVHYFDWKSVLRVLKGVVNNNITGNDYFYFAECVDILGSIARAHGWLDLIQAPEEELNEEFRLVPIQEIEDLREQMVTGFEGLRDSFVVLFDNALPGAAKDRYEKYQEIMDSIGASKNIGDVISEKVLDVVDSLINVERTVNRVLEILVNLDRGSGG